ncbi:MAG TPA: di-heme oxidoredictase family protein [Oligoflexus sp.]|uniref:di-heme oxidoreductase family protein n=1 Tax=Oligoflexus sp. TaxID=1971216 RepID=UPI002D449255|nr:di-heme oxidoredictase family protein [Oligoflexus sp.]HYX38486.1 di-heme oxidoredictase family protein [Oligoflexus sp.]
MVRRWLTPWLVLVSVGCGRPDKDVTFPEVSLVLAGGDTTIKNRTSSAFTAPATNLNEEEFNLHGEGDILFEGEFVMAPAPVRPGLGPTFNNTSCRGCHVRNGRGMPVLGENGTLRSPILVRVSLDPTALDRFPEARSLQGPGHGPYPVPGFGTQIQNHAVFGHEPEIGLSLSWEEATGTYPDGSPYTLRKPILGYSGSAEKLAVMQDSGVLRSIRQTPPVVGLGLLEAIPDQTLIDNEDPDDADGDGISGRLNRVWDPVAKTIAIGRFGWKASAPSLIVQTGNAFADDMGVKNPLAPDADGSIEISEDIVRKTAFYTQTLAVPDRIRTNPSALEGEKVFHQIACTGCHTPSLSTDGSSSIAALQNQTFAAFTDLMLHDMGEGLADGRPDYLASGQEWRTPPLWGLGLTGTILPQSGYLHDGRARTLEEAILWHGGEAEASRKAFEKLPKNERGQVIDFLKSL